MWYFDYVILYFLYVFLFLCNGRGPKIKPFLFLYCFWFSNFFCHGSEIYLNINIIRNVHTFQGSVPEPGSRGSQLSSCLHWIPMSHPTFGEIGLKKCLNYILYSLRFLFWLSFLPRPILSFSGLSTVVRKVFYGDSLI